MKAHIEIEYDPRYCGGDFDDVGETICIPVVEIPKGKRGVERAFRKLTGLDPIHIIHYCPDEYCDADGNLLDE